MQFPQRATKSGVLNYSQQDDTIDSLVRCTRGVINHKRPASGLAQRPGPHSPPHCPIWDSSTEQHSCDRAKQTRSFPLAGYSIPAKACTPSPLYPSRPIQHLRCSCPHRILLHPYPSATSSPGLHATPLKHVRALVAWPPQLPNRNFQPGARLQRLKDRHPF